LPVPVSGGGSRPPQPQWFFDANHIAFSRLMFETNISNTAKLTDFSVQQASDEAIFPSQTFTSKHEGS
jgi:hypothetical protein